MGHSFVGPLPTFASFAWIIHSPKFLEHTMTDPRKLCPPQVRSMWQALAKKLVPHAKVKGVDELALWIGGLYPSISGNSHFFWFAFCLL